MLKFINGQPNGVVLDIDENIIKLIELNRRTCVFFLSNKLIKFLIT